MATQTDYEGPIDSVDTETGEVLYYNGATDDTSTALVPLLPKKQEPLALMLKPLCDQRGTQYLHLAMAAEKGISEEEMTSYTEADWVEIGDETMGQALTIIGACVWFSGPFSPQSEADKPEDERRLAPGYFKVLFKTTRYKNVKVMVGNRVIKIRQPMVVATSSKRVAELALAMIQKHGWYDWDGVKKTLVFSGSKAAGYRATLIDMSKIVEAQGGDDDEDDDDDAAEVE